MNTTTNYLKHTNTNPIQKYLIQNFNTRLLECVTLAAPQDILDAGCGEGFTMNIIQESGLCKHIFGIDNSQTALTIAHNRYPAMKFSKASIYDIPHKSNSFDMVICSEVLEHLEKPENALIELIRVSRKYILLSVPNEPYFQLANFIRGKYIQRFGNHPEHIQHWSTSKFTELLQRQGLKIVKIYTPFAWTIVLASKA